MDKGNLQVRPSENDNQRLETLSKEIYERMKEYARIVAATLGQDPNLPLKKFTFIPTNDQNNSSIMSEIWLEPPPSTEGRGGSNRWLACYQNPPGVCCPECPCT